MSSSLDVVPSFLLRNERRWICPLRVKAIKVLVCDEPEDELSPRGSIPTIAESVAKFRTAKGLLNFSDEVDKEVVDNSCRRSPKMRISPESIEITRYFCFQRSGEHEKEEFHVSVAVSCIPSFGITILARRCGDFQNDLRGFQRLVEGADVPAGVLTPVLGEAIAGGTSQAVAVAEW